MERDRKIGLALIALSVVLFFMIYMLMQTIVELRLELHKSCPLPPAECPYKSSVPNEVVLAFIFVAILGSFGAFLIFVPRQILPIKDKKKIKQVIKGLKGEEKRIYDIISESEGFVYQSDLIEKTGFSKVKISRILDRLETKVLIERRRRGMSNVVVLKD